MSIGSATKTVEDVTASLACSSTEDVSDDLSFFDHMTGLNCYHDDEPPTLVRIYERPSSPAQVLQDWAPALMDNWQVVIGPNWFVIGQPKHIDAFVGVEDAKAATRFVPTPTPLSEREEALTSCVTFMTSTLVALTMDPVQYEQQAPYLDQQYPGASSLIKSLARPHVLAEMRSLSEQNSLTRDAYLSQFGDELKSFCELAQS